MTRRAAEPKCSRTLRPYSLELPGFGPRTVRVHVPNREDGGPRRGLFLFDGQNVFDDPPSFAGGWHVHEAVDRLPRGTVDAPVVIGIDHGHERRISELSPWREGPHDGEAERFLDAVTSTVVPWAVRELGLLPGPQGAVVGGSSMGGLAALYAHFRYPEVFGGAICMSPSFWIAGRAIFPFIERRPTPSVSRVYIDCGAREARGRMLPLAEQMARHLGQRGYAKGQLLWRPDARGTHSERHWRRRVPLALRFMFRRPDAPRP